MAKNFGRVNVSISASTGGLTKGLKSASGQMQSFSSQMASLNSRMGTLVFLQGAQMFAGFVRGVTNATRSLISMGQAQAGVIDSNAKLSRRLGVTYGELAGLKLAGELAGVSMETIGAAMTKADVAMTKALGGSKAATAAFKTLGLNLNSLQGMSGADRFEAIATAISKLPTAAERSAAAVALFGRSGAQLLPLFEGGAAGIAQARAEASKFGLSLTNMQSKQVEAMNDAFTRVRAAISGIVGQVVAYLAPAIQGVVKQFTDFIGTANGANIGQAIGDALLGAAEYLAGVGDYIIANFGPSIQKVFAYLSQVGEQWNAVMAFGNRVASFFAAVFDGIKFALGGIILAFTGSFEVLLNIAQFIAKLLRVDSKTLNSLADQTKAFNDSIVASMDDAAVSMGKNLKAAFDPEASGNEAGKAIATPLTDAVRGFRQQAKEAAGAIDEATSKDVQVTTAVEVSSKELGAIVAGSSAGESFRNAIMRGADPRNAGESAEEKIADGVDEMNDKLEELPEQFASAMNAQFGLATITA
jgi:hypothetical protein